MAQRFTVIDLTKDKETYQDKIDRLEATVARIEQKIDSIMEMIAKIKERSPKVPDSALKNVSIAPIYTVAPPIVHTTSVFECNAQQLPGLHAFLIERTLGELSSKIEGKDVSDAKIEAVRETALHFANQPKHDETSDPHSHQDALNNWVTRIGQDTLKRKSMESFESLKAKAPFDSSKRNGEVQSIIERKTVINEVSGPPLLKAWKPLGIEACSRQIIPTFTPGLTKKRLPEFTSIPETYANLFGRLKILNMVHPIEPKRYRISRNADMAKSCVYHSGLRGHDIEECIVFKEEVEDLIKASQIRIIPSNGYLRACTVITPSKDHLIKKGY